MVIKPDWSIFKFNFPENPQQNFEWLCYELFCREFKCESGISRKYNQPSLEAEPIVVGKEIIGFQAKFYTVALKERKKELKETVRKAQERYASLTKIIFYINSDWTCSNNSTEKSEDNKNEAEREIEKYASTIGIQIDWRTDSFFESPFVTTDNIDISKYFFSKSTDDYYEKIKNFPQRKTTVQEKNKYKTLLKLSGESKIENNFSIYEYLKNLLQRTELEEFPNVFIKGIAGVSKSTEMQFAYNKLLCILSEEKSYYKFTFLPTPYFYELRDYFEGCFGELNDKSPLLFLDGLDEISDQKVMILVKELHNLQAKNPNCRFIISGRDASFINEMNEFNHVTTKLLPYIDYTTQQIINNFKGTPLESLVSIPFYRDFASTENAKTLKTYKDFISALILNKLESDKKKVDRSANKTSSRKYDSTIDLENIQNKLTNIAHNLHKSKERSFCKEYLYSYLNEDEIFFFLKSSIVSYRDDQRITFISNLFFEYFLARYYSKQSLTIIYKDFFLQTGTIIIQYVNVFTILLNLFDTKSKKFKKIIKRLGKSSSEIVLLSDYEQLSIEDRFKYYKRILGEYNFQKKYIYYTRFSKSHDLLVNINSLSALMHELLPEELYDDAIKLHCDTINNFLKNPNVEDITTFENAVILLGVHDKFWEEKQYPLLKKISIPLIKFFRENQLAEKVKGLLSEDIILSWYEEYGWTNNWNEKEWISFVREITNIESDDFYNFNTENDFRIKLKLFIHFHKNSYIKKLLVPLAIKILTIQKFDSDMAAVMPRSLDDNFKTPTIRFDTDISNFTFTIENYVIPITDILYILNSVGCDYIHHNSVYQLEELYRKIISQLENRISHISEDNLPELYKLFTIYINTEDGIYISDFNKFIKLLNDNQKIEIFNLLLNDLTKNINWQKLWMLHQSIVILLDIKNVEKSCLLSEKLKCLDRLYGECIANIYVGKLDKHPLYETALSQYPLFYPETIKKDEKRQLRLSEIETKIHKMQESEIDIITKKEVFLEEVQNIFKYIDETEDISNRNSDRGKLLDLQTDYIYNKVQYDYRDYNIPPIFSSFAIKFLFNSTDENQKLNREETLKNIEDWFSSEKYFWRYFFWLFICHYKKEESDKFLEDNPVLIEKIKESMEQEVSYFIEENDISIYDGGRNRFWVVPFVHYLSRFYNNKLPDWFDKNKILNFIAYPAWQLSTGYGVHINGEFKWQSWDSVFDWIETVSGFSEDVIIEKALSLLSELKSDQSQTQVITVFVEKVKSVSAYKQQMLNAIIDKTIVEIQKDYKDHSNTSIMNGGALSSFWRETQEDLIDKLYPYVDFSKYNPDDINYCRRSVFEYICKNVNLKQKAKIIDSLKNSISEKNVRIYLSKLGYDKAIILTINEFLNGESFNTDYAFYSPLFGKANASLRLLNKYFQLYEYSLEKSNDRRNYLIGYAKEGILQTTTKNNFWFIKKKFKKLIKKLKKDSQYFEGVEDFLNEIEQRIFSDDNDD